jgi:adenine-specific DNA-methyltransferase
MPELYFKGKEFVYNHHLSVPYRPLVPDSDKSQGESTLDGNLIIHGDNLHALKALLPRYAGKVDCIFIDPPYNTGNENWNYNDNVNSPMMREWLRSNPVNKEDMLRHDKWLCMMYPRLRLLKELLSEDGHIAVTIDDNELDNLLLAMDEIFDSDNRLAVAVWLSDPSGGKQKSALRVGHEYVVIYGGGSPELRRETKVTASLDLEDTWGGYAKGRELNKWGAGSLRSDRESMFFPLTAPDEFEVYPIRNDGKEGRWRYGKESSFIKQILDDPDTAHWEKRPFDVGILVDGKNERWVPYEKVRDPNKVSGWSTWLDKIATNADGTKTLKEVFGEKVFETPKPVALIEWIISLSGNPDCIVLDSFAGSGTTAHAVLSLNKSDEGSRRFILVEFEDYADSITAERVRRVITGYEFKGVQREELFRSNLTFTALKNADRLLDKVQAINNLESSRFDRIKKEVKAGELIVVGEKQVEETAGGLGGSFSFCLLGDPLDLDKLLTGEQLPDYDAIGAWLFHTATGEALSAEAVDSSNWFLGESKGYFVWLIYKPDLKFLKSRDAALTFDLAEQIAKSKTGKRHLVFGPSKFVPSKMLLPLGVEYAPLPFALYKLEKDRANGT